jgi:hypothetical protein
VYGKPVGLRQVDGHEVDAAVHEPGDERDVAGQPIELGDDQGGVVDPASREGLGELGRSDRLPLSTWVNSSTSFQSPPFRWPCTASRWASNGRQVPAPFFTIRHR